MLDHELNIYNQLKDFQAKYIPFVRGYASGGGNMKGYCMSYANRIVAWNHELKQKAKHALKKLAILSGLLQRDLHQDNFVVTDDGVVWILDMEEMSLAQDNEKKRYISK